MSSCKNCDFTKFRLRKTQNIAPERLLAPKTSWDITRGSKTAHSAKYDAEFSRQKQGRFCQFVHRNSKFRRRTPEFFCRPNSPRTTSEHSRGQNNALQIETELVAALQFFIRANTLTKTALHTAAGEYARLNFARLKQRKNMHKI